jgi:hypothetical protein
MDLAEIAEAGDATRLFAGARERGEQDGDQDGDDADDDEQLDQREG